MNAPDRIGSDEAAAICGMTVHAWRLTASRSAKGRVDPPQPRHVGTDESRSGRPYLYDRAEVEAWAKVRRRRGDRRFNHPEHS